MGIAVNITNKLKEREAVKMKSRRKSESVRSLARVLVLSVLCVVAFAGVSQARSDWDVNVNVDIGVFFDSLAPYGTWIQTDSYGWCWVPSVVEYDATWRPYVSGGHWVWTNWGWTWVSYYNWGWAPYHYGRWVVIDYGRWAWVPGYVWGPAWVSWRVGGGYIGWYPLPPDVDFRWDIGIRYHHNHFRLGFYYDNYPGVWTFVPAGRFSHVRVSNYALPERRVVNIYNITNNVTNIYYDSKDQRVVDYGPDVRYVERYAGKKITEYRLAESSKIGQPAVQKGNVLEVYKPRLVTGAAMPKGEKVLPSGSDMLMQSKRAQDAFANKFGRTYKEQRVTPVKVLTRSQITAAEKEGINVLNPALRKEGKRGEMPLAPGMQKEKPAILSPSGKPESQKGVSPYAPGIQEKTSPVMPPKITGKEEKGVKREIAPGMEGKGPAPKSPYMENLPGKIAPAPQGPKSTSPETAPGMKIKKEAPAQKQSQKSVQPGMEQKTFWSQPESPAMKSGVQRDLPVQAGQKQKAVSPAQALFPEEVTAKSKARTAVQPGSAQIKQENKQALPGSELPPQMAPGKKVPAAPAGAQQQVPGMTPAAPGQPGGPSPVLKSAPGTRIESGKPGAAIENRPRGMPVQAENKKSK
jgi:hypothetical protein